MPDFETILVLDRDAESVRCIREALAPRGYRLVAFTDPSRTIAFASERKPVAVFVDLALAGESHGDFFAKFRGLHPLVPIVVAAAASQAADLQGVIHFGVNEHLVKPFSALQAVQALSRALREDDVEFEKAMTAISARIRETRRRLGLKQSVVASRTGLSVAQICQIENRASTPSLNSLLRICRALHTPVGEIVAGI